MAQNSQPVLVVAALIRRYGDPEKKILIVRRGPGQTGAGAWEFPGGKVEKGESPEQALVREIQEELGIEIKVGALLGEAIYAYPSKVIKLRVHWSESLSSDLQLVEHDAFKWLRAEEIQVSELSEADRPFVEMILQGSK